MVSAVLLIQSNVRLDSTVTRRAIDKAKSCGETLIVLAVLDPAIPEKVAAQFTEAGHIGPRPSESFLSSLYQRHEELALEQADEIVTDAQIEGLDVRSIVRRGDYATETAQVIREEKPGAVVIEKRRRSLLRFATGDRFIDGLQREEGFELVEV